MDQYRFLVGIKIWRWIWWRRISKRKFLRVVFRYCFSQSTNFVDAVTMLAHGKIVLTVGKRFYKVEIQ